jgi:hypothetical protein
MKIYPRKKKKHTLISSLPPSHTSAASGSCHTISPRAPPAPFHSSGCTSSCRASTWAGVWCRRLRPAAACLWSLNSNNITGSSTPWRSIASSYPTIVPTIAIFILFLPMCVLPTCFGLLSSIARYIGNCLSSKAEAPREHVSDKH